MLMVLGFVVGLVPSHEGPGATGATASSDRIDMVDLIDLVLGVKGVSGITLSSPVQGVLVKTPEDNFVTPEIPVPLQANVAGDGSELVTFVANPASSATAFPSAGVWSGDVFSEPVALPFASAIDVGAFVTGNANTTTQLAVYALVNTAQSAKAVTLTYTAANDPIDALPLTIFETTGNVDNDNNGFPDDPFANVLPGEIWISNQQINGQLRTVLVANLDNGGGSKGLGTVFTSPSGNVTVDSPDLQSFIDAGAIANGETGLLLVEVVNNIAGVVDQVNGSSDPAVINDWAVGVNALAPGALVTGAQFVEISVVYSLYGGTAFDEINVLPSGLSINLTLSGLTIPQNADTGLYSYPTEIIDQGGSVIVTNEPGEGTWTQIPATVAGNGLTAALTTLSTFAPFAVDNTPPVSITGASPNTVPEDFSAEVTITGVFPALTALNAAQAASAYRVYIGGQVAAFREVGGVAVTAYSGADNSIFVTVPAFEDAGFLDVTVVNLGDESDNATSPGLIEVLQTVQVVSATDGSGTGTVTLSPTSGTGLPAGFYFQGDVIAATAAPAVDNTFDGWAVNGTPAGTANPLTIIATETGDDVASVVTATFSQVVIVLDWALTVNATAGGSAAATTPTNENGRYDDGTIVSLVAVANPGFVFSGWTGAVANAAAASTTITMTADSVVTANFSPIGYSINLTTGGTGGTATILTAPNGPGGNTFLIGTTVVIQATPDNGFEFAGWTGADAGLLSKGGAGATASLTINAGTPTNIQLIANFQQVQQPVSITGITPNAAWIFGGVVARISGTGLTNDTTITIGGQTVQGFRAFANGSSVDVVIPPTTDDSTAATVPVDVTVSDGVDTVTLVGGFTYNRYETDGDGVNSTAFIVSNPGAGQAVDVTLNGDNNSFAELTLPSLDVPAGVNTVYGIARAALNDTSKANTAAIASLGTNSIASGAPVDGVYDFSLHLYASSAQAKANTPAVGGGTLSNTSGLINFGRPVDENGNPIASTPVLLSFPLDGSDITYGDVRNSLTLWGVETAFDYVTRVTTVSDPKVVAYQSEILNNEVDPALTPASANAAQPNLINQARIYSLNGFSLRKGAVIPATLTDGVRLKNATGTAKGDVAGGDSLTIVSPGGGLANIDRIVFTAATAKAVGGTVSTVVTPSGTTEFQVQFATPASADPGIANIVLFGKANPNSPIVSLNRVFEFTREGRDLTPLLLLLLGLLIAGLGLAAGGDSGGGGGGPCFIATAAYGTPLASEINTLRDVRDNYLLSNTIGTAFVDTYYHVSPAIADAVAAYPVLAALVRVALVPLIFLGKVALLMPTLTAMVGLSIGAFYFMRRRAGKRA